MNQTACVAVLLVEDDAAIRCSVASYLREQGYRVYEASSAEAGATFLETTPLQCLILADLVMRPKPGMLIGAVRRGHRFATLPIIVSHPSEADEPRKAHAQLSDILKMVAENCVREV